MLEQLEPRRLLDADLSNNTLTITGSPGNDVIRLTIQSGKLLLVMTTDSPGDAFRDQYTQNSVRRVVVEAGDGDDEVEIDPLFSKPATLNGGLGNDTLIGASGNDSIDGGEGDDFLDGGFDLGLSSDILIGGPGFDLANYSHHTQPLKIDLDGNRDDGQRGERDNVHNTVEGVIGGGSHDEITSNLSVPVVLIGNGGNDTLSSSGGDDFLDGGPGRDFLNARGGNDTLRGGLGTDTMLGGTGNDTADYNTHTKDVVINLDGIPNDGSAGENDLINIDIENLIGGAGNDMITGSNANNLLDGRGGNDSIIALGGNDMVFGGLGNDTMDGGSGNDTLDGGLGADQFIGGPGTDTASYRFRAERLIITINNVANDGATLERDNVRTDIEVVEGGSGNDSIVGGSAAETLLGGFGNDTLIGGSGNDLMDGGPGNDVMDGGAGADLFLGGPGNRDTADYSSRIGDLFITLDEFQDDGEFELDFVDIDVEIVLCGSGNDQVFGSSRANTFMGAGGNDTLFGGGGADSLDGGVGNDLFDGEGGADVMVGGPGIDTVDYSSRTEDQDLDITLDDMPGDGSGDNDNVMSDIEVVLCGAGDDEVTAGNFDVTVFGGDGEDTLRGGDGDDHLFGEGDADSLIGGRGSDTLEGGAGNDTLNSRDVIFADTVDGGDDDDVADADFIDTVINVP